MRAHITTNLCKLCDFFACAQSGLSVSAAEAIRLIGRPNVALVGLR
jgi:hypothetical protein